MWTTREWYGNVNWETVYPLNGFLLTSRDLFSIRNFMHQEYAEQLPFWYFRWHYYRSEIPADDSSFWTIPVRSMSTLHCWKIRGAVSTMPRCACTGLGVLRSIVGQCLNRAEQIGLKKVPDNLHYWAGTYFALKRRKGKGSCISASVKNSLLYHRYVFAKNAIAGSDKRTRLSFLLVYARLYLSVSLSDRLKAFVL